MLLHTPLISSWITCMLLMLLACACLCVCKCVRVREHVCALCSVCVCVCERESVCERVCVSDLLLFLSFKMIPPPHSHSARSSHPTTLLVFGLLWPFPFWYADISLILLWILVFRVSSTSSSHSVIFNLSSNNWLRFLSFFPNVLIFPISPIPIIDFLQFRMHLPIVLLSYVALHALLGNLIRHVADLQGLIAAAAGTVTVSVEYCY